MLNNREISVFIVASESPKILKVTSLQLIVFSFNSFKSSSVVRLLFALFRSQTKDSLIKPCSIPKW